MVFQNKLTRESFNALSSVEKFMYGSINASQFCWMKLRHYAVIITPIVCLKVLSPHASFSYIFHEIFDQYSKVICRLVSRSIC